MILAALVQAEGTGDGITRSDMRPLAIILVGLVILAVFLTATRRDP